MFTMGARRGRKKRTYHFLKVFDLREGIPAVRPRRYGRGNGRDGEVEEGVLRLGTRT
jgi:hypothetical protein